MFYAIGSCFKLSGARRNALSQPHILDFIISALRFLTLTPRIPAEVSLRDLNDLFFIIQLLLFSIFHYHSINCHRYQSPTLVHAFISARHLRKMRNNDTRPQDTLVEFRVGAL